MNVVMWVIIIHLIEIIGIAGYLLIRKNSKLERVVAEQQNYIDAISIIIQDSENTIRELEVREEDLENDLDDLKTDYNELQENYNELKSQYDHLLKSLIDVVDKFKD